jgi:O-antigen/teichoic acid export membrane protein
MSDMDHDRDARPGPDAADDGSVTGPGLVDGTTGDGRDEDDAELRAAMSRGLKWSAASVGVARAASMLSSIVLARILVPDDFGVFAPALALVNILFGLNDLGLLLAVVRWKGDLREAARTAHTIALAFSGVLYAICFAGAPWFAETMGSPDTAPILRVLALTVFIDGWTTVSHGLLVRDFHQDRFAKAEFASMPVGIGTGIVLALAGFGAWSLALSQVLANVVSGVMVYRAAPMHPGFGFSAPVARRLLSYGLPLAGTSLVEYGLLNADYLIVSRATDPATLGIYLLAFNVSNWPITTITDAVRRVSIAGFARMEDRADLLKARFSSSLSMLLTAALPMIVAMALLATPLIGFLYGDKWLPSAPVLQVLVVLSFARMAIGFIFDLLVGVGRTRTTMLLKIVWLVVLVPALMYGVRADSIEGVAVAHVLVAGSVALPLFALAAQRAGADMGDVVRRMARPLLAAAVAVAVGLVVRDHLGGRFTTLAAGASVIVVAYLSLVLRRGSVVAVRDWVRARRPGARAAR